MKHQLLFFYTVAVMAFVPPTVISLSSSFRMKMIQLAQKISEIRRDKQFYIELETQLGWLDATQFCKFHGMELAAISTKGEQAKLELVFKNHSNATNQPLWLSGMKVGDTSYYWMSSGRKVIFKNWEPEYPSATSVGSWCIWTPLGNPSKWRDASCVSKYSFICEYYDD